MCGRLGIHQTFSQPHRPRANGRAERAGQQLLSTLKEIHLEHGINWVGALPRALAIHHNTVGPAGLSPFHILFGRDRSVPGIPYHPERESEDAQAFFLRMEQVDQLVAQTINRAHEAAAWRHNTKPEREPFPPSLGPQSPGPCFSKQVECPVAGPLCGEGEDW